MGQVYSERRSAGFSGGACVGGGAEDECGIGFGGVEDEVDFGLTRSMISLGSGALDLDLESGLGSSAWDLAFPFPFPLPLLLTLRLPQDFE